MQGSERGRYHGLSNNVHRMYDAIHSCLPLKLVQNIMDLEQRFDVDVIFNKGTQMLMSKVSIAGIICTDSLASTGPVALCGPVQSICKAQGLSLWYSTEGDCTRRWPTCQALASQWNMLKSRRRIIWIIASHELATYGTQCRVCADTVTTALWCRVIM